MDQHRLENFFALLPRFGLILNVLQSAKNTALRKEYKALDMKLKAAKDEIFTEQTKVKHLSVQKKKVDAVSWSLTFLLSILVFLSFWDMN